MMKALEKTDAERIPFTPFGLIENDEQYHKMLAMVERIMASEESLSEDEERSYCLAIHLIEVYEQENFAIPDAKPLEVLHHLMEAHNLRQADLIGILSRSRGVISEICNGKRSITLNHAKALGNFFGVDYGIFI